MDDLPKGFAVDLPEELSKQGIDGLVLAISVAAKPFFAQGCDHVVVARHCGKLYVGLVTPERCGACGETDSEELRIVYARPDEDGHHGILLSSQEPS